MCTVHNSAHIFCIFSIQKARKSCTPTEPIDNIVGTNVIKLHHRGQEKKEHAKLFFLFGQCSLIKEKELTTCGPSTSTRHCSVRLSPILENFPILQNTDVLSGKEEAWAGGGGGACLTPSRICLSYNLALQSRSTLIGREESFGGSSEKINDKSTVGEAEKMLLTAAEM